MMRTRCHLITVFYFISVLLVGICTGKVDHKPAVGCDFPFNCDGRSPYATCHEWEEGACKNKVASCTDTETCCSAYELQWKCKHISTDLHLDSRFTGYTSFSFLESVGIAGNEDEPQGQPHGGRITTPQGEIDSKRSYEFPATKATHLKFPRLRSVNNDVAIVGLPYLKELNMKEFEYWYTNSGSRGQMLSDHAFVVAENDKLMSIVLPKYTAGPASCSSEQPRPCEYPDKGDGKMKKIQTEEPGTYVPPLTIMDNPELKWLVISNTNLDGLAHPHGPTLFQSGNSEEVKIIAVSKTEYPSWLKMLHNE